MNRPEDEPDSDLINQLSGGRRGKRAAKPRAQESTVRWLQPTRACNFPASKQQVIASPLIHVIVVTDREPAARGTIQNALALEGLIDSDPQE